MGSPPLRFPGSRWHATDFVGAPGAARAGRRRTPGALRRAIMPPGWVLLQQPQNEFFERRRDTASRRREQFRLIVKNRVRNRDLLITTEWLSAREHLVQHDTECPQVGTRIHVPAADLL